MNLVICPGCGESFDPDHRIAIADFNTLGVDLVVPIETEHYTDDEGRLFCCIDCWGVNA